MEENIFALKKSVEEAAQNPEFVHHKWFTKYHLEVVAKIAGELCEFYPNADRKVVEVMAWMHDYGKIIDYGSEYATTQAEGPKLLQQLGFDEAFIKTVVSNIDVMDKKLELDLGQANIETQIVSSADGCSHLASPFMLIFWNTDIEPFFRGKNIDEIMVSNIAKINKDWDRKIVLPEARKAFQKYYEVALVQHGQVPDKYLG